MYEKERARRAKKAEERRLKSVPKKVEMIPEIKSKLNKYNDLSKKVKI
jgi:hypothetical protein